jgi:hypothetical protein
MTADRSLFFVTQYGPSENNQLLDYFGISSAFSVDWSSQSCSLFFADFIVLCWRHKGRRKKLDIGKIIMGAAFSNTIGREIRITLSRSLTGIAT